MRKLNQWAVLTAANRRQRRRGFSGYEDELEATRRELRELMALFRRSFAADTAEERNGCGMLAAALLREEPLTPELLELDRVVLAKFGEQLARGEMPSFQKIVQGSAGSAGAAEGNEVAPGAVRDVGAGKPARLAEPMDLEELLGRTYDPPPLYIYEEVEIGGGYHSLHVAPIAKGESDWSEPWKKSGHTKYRSRVVRVPYPPEAVAYAIDAVLQGLPLVRDSFPPKLLEALDQIAHALGSVGAHYSGRLETVHSELEECKRQLGEAHTILKVRPVVSWFAAQMEAKLEKNDHKDGWDQSSTSSLLARVFDELGELIRAMVPIVGGANDSLAFAAHCARQAASSLRAVGYYAQYNGESKKVVGEAADAANMLLMVADHFRDGGPSTDSGRSFQTGGS